MAKSWKKIANNIAPTDNKIEFDTESLGKFAIKGHTEDKIDLLSTDLTYEWYVSGVGSYSSDNRPTSIVLRGRPDWCIGQIKAQFDLTNRTKLHYNLSASAGYGNVIITQDSTRTVDNYRSGEEMVYHQTGTHEGDIDLSGYTGTWYIVFGMGQATGCQGDLTIGQETYLE